jgi:hypothetical protein
MSWEPSVNLIAQTAHFLGAATLVLLAARLGSPWWGQALAVLGWAVPKEWLFDLLVEQDTVKGSGRDFLWYMIGGLASILVCSLT